MALEVGALLTGLTELGKTASEMLGAKGAAERQALFTEFQKALQQSYTDTIAYQQTSMALLQRNDDLEKEVVRLKDWSADSKRYRLVNTGARGVFYALKESMKDGDPPHYLCTTCYQAGKKSFLGTKTPPGGHPLLSCPVCNTEVELTGRGQHTYSYAPD